MSREDILISAFDLHVQDKASQLKASEYKKARHVFFGDLNGDGKENGCIIYTLEGGINGGNYDRFSLAVFLNNVDQSGKDDLLYQIDSKKNRLYEAPSDPDPIYSRSIEDQESLSKPEQSDNANNNEFAYEKDLQNFLAKNLSSIEAGITLYTDEDIGGIEFTVGNRFIDILAIDKDKDNDYVVIEFKVSRGYDRVVSQILRYMAWIRKHHADDNQKVRGIIIAREISDDLLLACSEIQNLELYEYNLSVTLNKIDNI